MASNENGEVPEHDDFGTLGDSRNDGRLEAEGDAQAISGKVAGVNAPAAAGERLDGRAIEAGEEKLVEDLTLGILRTEWAGPLPPPEILHSYTLDEQAKIMAWGDARILDESGRSDRLVDYEIWRGKAAVILSFVIEVVLAIGPIVGYAITGYKEMLWAYTVLGASLIGNVVININGKKTKGPGQNDGE